MIQPQIDMLLQYFGREVDELVRAKEEYFSQTGGEVHADDRCYEQRMQAFFNWFLLDRRQANGATPIERFLREKGGAGPALRGRQRTLNLIGPLKSIPVTIYPRGKSWICLCIQRSASSPLPAAALRVRRQICHLFDPADECTIWP